MNLKIIATGAVALGLVLAGYNYRHDIADKAASLISGQNKTTAKTTDKALAASSRKRRRGSSGGAVPVSLATVEQRAAPQQLTAIGSVQAMATVGVKARVDGQLTAAYFNEGQRVKKGQKLFTIDPRPFALALRQAEASLARDKAGFEKTKTDLARYQELVDMGYASRQKYEEVKAANAAAGAVLAADQATIEQARLQLDYTTIKAPIDGRTGSLLVSVGNLVKANDANPLTVITQLWPIYVTFSVPERYLLQIRALMTANPVAVEARLGGEGGKAQAGKLSFINNAVDAATGTIQLKATFDNENEMLTPGAFVNVALTIKERPNAIVIPSSAVQIGQKGNFVYVAKADNTVEMRPIKVADTNVRIAVISEGLKPGEKVVTDGQLQLVPGAKIRERKAAPNGNVGNNDNGAATPKDGAAASGGAIPAAAGEPRKKRGKRQRAGNGT